MSEAPAPSMRLLQAGPTDAAELSRLHARAFERAWSPMDFTRFLEAGALACLARIEGSAVALGLFQFVAEEAEVLTLATDPAHRGRRIAGALIHFAVDSLTARGVRRLILEVAADNLSARALYDRCGFHEIGRRRAYYPRADGSVDAYVLARTLEAGDVA